MPEVELLDKTEVWVHGVALQQADLRALAASAAGALGLDPKSVFVTDARDDHIRVRRAETSNGPPTSSADNRFVGGRRAGSGVTLTDAPRCTPAVSSA